MSGAIPFVKEIVKDYLDTCIRYWRKELLKETDKERWEGCEEGVLRARCYIDAFQSVRTTLFGELLPAEERERDKTCN